jgi:hypothetical protein
MEKTIAGNTDDPEVGEEIINNDGEWESAVLYRTAIVPDCLREL